jgi:hypothetical protein
MTKLEELQKSYHIAQGAFEAIQANRNGYIKLVLDALGIWGRAQVENVWIFDRTVRIEYGISCRGSVDYETIDLPMSIFESDDVFQAAAEYHRCQEIAKANAERDQKLQELKRLKEELGQE